MARKSANSKSVVVAGDVTIDWNLACMRRGTTGTPSWNTALTRACWQPGGAALLGALVAEVAGKFEDAHDVKVHVPKVPMPKGPIDPCDRDYHHAYAMWSLFYDKGDKENVPSWRVTDFLGLDRSHSPACLKKKVVYGRLAGRTL
ncbi:MAG: hypothetical protein U9Q79_01580 [Candidatus Hydrogenedentes bacterium]|nr:hypothetical protein [Candidatus Hydrogenedentota bacterium]